MTNFKCPKCGGNNFQFIDKFMKGYIFEVMKGKVYQEGVEGEGDYVNTEWEEFEAKYKEELHPDVMKYLYDNFPQGLTKNQVRKALKEILRTDYDW